MQSSIVDLHLVGYSEPVNKVMSLDDLKPYIYTDPDQLMRCLMSSYYSRRGVFAYN